MSGQPVLQIMAKAQHVQRDQEVGFLPAASGPRGQLGPGPATGSDVGENLFVKKDDGFAALLPLCRQNS
jgi:hypothetical protein